MATIQDTLDFAFQCHQAGDLRQAERLYADIIATDPSHADAHHLLGIVAYQTGRFDAAIASMGKALALNPRAAIYYSNMGLAQKAAGQLHAATVTYEQALRLKPDFAEAHSNLGEVLEQQGRCEEAESHCRMALQLRPEFPQAFNALGNALLGQKRFDEAVACYQEALRLNPGMAKALNNLGNALVALNELDEAVDSYQQALRLEPQFAEASYNLGNALRRQGKLDEAKACYRQAIAIKPNHVGAHNNLANVTKEQGRFDEALACYDQAMRCDFGLGETHLNRGMLLLLVGRWEEGWPEYEWRWRTKEFAWYEPQRPRWDGSRADGRTILVDCEQGNGDTLQFVRYAALVKERAAATVMVRCQPALVPLLATCAGIDRVVPNGAALPPFDFQVPLLSLPGIFQTTPDSIPAKVPYLSVDPSLVERWRQELSAANANQRPALQVGIAWKGSPTFLYDRERSIPLLQFDRLAKLHGVRLISLQKGPGTDQLRALGGRFHVVDLESRLGDENTSFASIAAIMKNLDLVISCDTAIAHLAGALGIPVWLALPFVPDWRWLLRREDTPWYPTMRLFRQTRPGDWDDVFERMAVALRQLPGFAVAEKGQGSGGPST